MTIDVKNSKNENKKEFNHDILCRLKGDPKPKNFATVDIETDGWEKPYAVGFFDGIDYFDFIGEDCIEKALIFILQPKYIQYRIYAHNGGNFDFLFFISELLSNKKHQENFKIDIIPVNSTVLRLDVYQTEKTRELDTKTKKSVEKLIVRTGSGYRKFKWTFLDSYKLFPLKLDSVGEVFDIGRKVTLNLSYKELAKVENRHIMKIYLEQDCKLLYKAIEKFQRIINKLGGQVGITLPSTALDLFRRRYQREYIYTNRHFITCEDYGKNVNDSKCVGCGHALIRPSYYGGRTEIFITNFSPSENHEEAKIYDFNSMYPSCMLENMPIGQGTYVEKMSESELYNNATKKIGIAECEVEIPSTVYLPPLPWKRRNENKLLFPTGRFSGCWDVAELSLLKDIPGARIRKVKRSIWFDGAPIFRDFVNEIYKFRIKYNIINDVAVLRNSWNQGMDLIAKLLLNSLYGIFGMKEMRERLVINPNEEDLTKLTPMSFEANTWKEEVRVTPKYIIPQIAAHVTALSRVKLWLTMREVLRQGGRVYYCDTDSIVCSNATLETGPGLGQLKLEDTITMARFVRPKTYMLITKSINQKKLKEQNIKIRAKGLGPGIETEEHPRDKSYGNELSEREFISMVVQGSPVERYRLTKLREGLRSYINNKLTFPRVVLSTKQIRSEYDKREVLDNYDTKPLYICERS